MLNSAQYTYTYLRSDPPHSDCTKVCLLVSLYCYITYNCESEIKEANILVLVIAIFS